MNLISTFNVVHQMSTTHRYSNTHLSQRENILEHTGFVCVLVATMLSRFSTDIPHEVQRDVVPEFQTMAAEAMIKAAIHDVEETITGDIVRPVKYHSDESVRVFKEMEDQAALTALTNLGCPEFHRMWQKDKQELSGLFVRVADILAVVYKLYSETALNGHYSILKSCKSLKEYLSEIKVLVEKSYPVQQYPLVNLFFTDMLDDAISLVKTIEASSPRIASFENEQNAG